MEQVKRLSMCRICLVQDVRMFAVTDKNMQEVYQRLTDIPFVTEDRRPMLACFFCYAKLKQCCQMKTKCLIAEQLLAQTLKVDDEQKPLINQAQLDFCGGLKVTSTKVIISIVDGCQIEYNYVKEELPSDASVEGRDSVELKDPLQSDDSDGEVSLKEFKIEEDEDEELMNTKEQVPEDPEFSIQGQLALLPRNTESDSEDDLPLTKIQTIVREEPEVPQKRRRAVKKNTKGSAVVEKPTRDARSAKLEDNKQKKNRRPISNSTQKVNLQSHAHVCRICQRGFKYKSRLKEHILQHTVEKPYKCDTCQKSYYLYKRLKVHMRNHTDEKPYLCDICQKRFMQKQQLTIHNMRMHSSEKPYKCDTCEKRFKRREHLSLHTRIRVEHGCSYDLDL